MIKELTLQNFQSHKDTSIQFDPGVNIIVGSSDTGKSSILRALRWVVWNRPSGDSFRSNWGGRTKVELFTDNAHVIRAKDKQEEYVLGDTHFTAFRTDVPDEIIKALNLSEINLQTQLEAPFLLSNTPGEVAQHFNKIARLDKIDSGLQNVSRWIRELTQDIGYKKETKKKYEEDLLQYDYLEKFEIELEVLEDIEKDWLNKILQLNGFKKLLNNINIVSEEIKQEEQILVYQESVDSILALYTSRMNKAISYHALNNLINAIQQDIDCIEDEQQSVALETPVNIVLQLYKDYDDLTLQKNKLVKHLQSLSTIKQEILIKTDQLSELEDFWHNNFPAVCPLCGK